MNRSSPIRIKTRIETNNFDEMTAFYINIIGLTVVESWREGEDKGVILTAVPRDQQSGLLEIAESHLQSSVASVCLQFEVDEIQTFLGRLPEDIVYRGPEHKPWNYMYVYLRDPDGMKVIVYEQQDNQ